MDTKDLMFHVEIGLCAQNILTILGSTPNITFERAYAITVKGKKDLHFDLLNNFYIPPLIRKIKMPIFMICNW